MINAVCKECQQHNEIKRFDGSINKCSGNGVPLNGVGGSGQKLAITHTAVGCGCG